MKLTYGKQLLLTMVIFLISLILGTVLEHWIYRSIGLCICGLLWILHPVMPGNPNPGGSEKNILRLAGVVLILYGIFTRSHA